MISYQFDIHEDGSVHIRGKAKFLEDMSHFKGQTLIGEFRKPKKSRTNDQNSYFHVLLGIIQRHLLDLGWEQAFSLEWVKNYVKLNCLMLEEINENTSEVIKTIGETSKLSTKEFGEFIDRLHIWAADPDGLDLYLPSAGEQLTIETK